MTISNYAENKLLETLKATSFAVTTCYVKLHTGDPGEDGTSNAATEATRKPVTWASASGGSMASDAALTWTNVADSETYSHWTMWDDTTAGNCLWIGSLSSNATVTAGDTFEITTLTLTLE